MFGTRNQQSCTTYDLCAQNGALRHVGAVGGCLAPGISRVAGGGMRKAIGKIRGTT